MTKLEYLKQLEDALKNKLGRNEVNEIMRDYAEYFVEGQHQGKSDFEIARKLGEPEAVAKQIISEGMEDEETKAKKQKKERFKKKVKEAKEQVKGSSILKKILLLCLFAIALPFLIIGIAMVFGILAIVFGAVFGTLGLIAGTMIAVVSTALFSLVMAVGSVGIVPSTAVCFIVLIAIAATLFSLAVITATFMAARGLYRFIKALWIKFMEPSKAPSPAMAGGYRAPVYSTTDTEYEAASYHTTGQDIGYQAASYQNPGQDTGYQPANYQNPKQPASPQGASDEMPVKEAFKQELFIQVQPQQQEAPNEEASVKEDEQNG